MFSTVSLQATAFLEVVPAWLPPIAISSGFLLVSIGMGKEYFKRLFGHYNSYSPFFALFSTICLTGSITSAMYISIQSQNLVLLFVFFTFMSGRIIQGAITARIIQKISELFLSTTDLPASNTTQKILHHIKIKMKNRIVLFFITLTIIIHTSLSIISVYIFGTGDAIEAIERFWVGFFFLSVSGMVFDFRHFAHRIPWIAAIGLIIAVTGAFLYSPVNFSTFIATIAPYLESPVPDWIRLPLSAIGFLFGILIWAVFYTKQ